MELFLLGRALMKIGEEAMPAPPEDGTKRSGSARLILTLLSDIVGHPDSAVGEIARLKATGSVETNPDSTDRRRA